MRRMLMGMIFCFCATLFIGCQTNSDSQVSTIETTEDLTRYEVPTPENQLAKVLDQIKDEMRVFDVEAHHDSLFELVLSLEKEKGVPVEKTDIYAIVETYMDDYFRQLAHEILTEYNENYEQEEMDGIFEQTSRKGLYDLITLYEWTYYQKK